MSNRFQGPQLRGDRDLSLDVIRGVAIILVLGWHLNGAPSGNFIFDALRAPGSTFGWVGVDLFFVLSGFLIGRLVLQEARATASFDAKSFLSRRVLRLWPAVYVYLLAQLIARDKPWDTFLLQNLFHVQNYTGSSLAHLWSLAVEEHFYLVLALGSPILLKGGPRLAWSLFGVMLAALVARDVAVAAGISSTAIQSQTQFRADALAFGVLLATWSIYWPESFYRARDARWLWMLLVAVGVALLCAIPKESYLGNTVGYTVAYLTSGAFLLALYQLKALRRLKWFASLIALIGLYSYSMYIWHLVPARILKMIADKVDIEQPDLVLIASYAGAICAGAVMYHLVEWPMMRMRDRLLPSKRHAKPGTAPVDAATAST